MTVTRDAMATAQLNFIGKPISTNNVQSFVCWMASEGTFAEWNPMATTEPAQGATDFNSAGVKNYPDIQTGLVAFKATIENGLYTGILDCLDRSASPAETCSVITNSQWGSKPSPELVASVLTNWSDYASVVIGGSETPPVGPLPVPPDPIPVPSIPVPTTPTEDTVQVPTLQNGSTGPAVKNVQLLANAQGHATLAIDGIYGNETEGVIRALQAFWHITEDGICGNVTWGVLCNF